MSTARLSDAVDLVPAAPALLDELAAAAADDVTALQDTICAALEAVDPR